MGSGSVTEHFHALFLAGPYIYHKGSECPKDRGGNGGGALHRPPRGGSAFVNDAAGVTGK